MARSMTAASAAIGVDSAGQRTRRGLFTAVAWLLTGLLLVVVLLPLLRLVVETSPAGLADAAETADIRAAIGLSLQDAAITALVAAVLGVPMAYLLARSTFPGNALVQSVVDLPLAVPHSVVGIGLLLVLSRRAWVGGPALHLSISFYGTQAGIVAGMLFVSAPFMVDSARLAFEGVDPRLEQVARSLGAGPWRAFARVTVPLAGRGVLAGLVLTYARSISEFGAVAILAYFPMTAPVKVYDLFLQSGLQRSAAASVLLLGVTLSTFVVFRALAAQRVGPAARLQR
jgi:molybdate/tungstate transport system permease protein